MIVVTQRTIYLLFFVLGTTGVGISDDYYSNVNLSHYNFIMTDGCTQNPSRDINDDILQFTFSIPTT